MRNHRLLLTKIPKKSKRTQMIMATRMILGIIMVKLKNLKMTLKTTLKMLRSRLRYKAWFSREYFRPRPLIKKWGKNWTKLLKCAKMNKLKLKTLKNLKNQFKKAKIVLKNRKNQIRFKNNQNQQKKMMLKNRLKSCHRLGQKMIKLKFQLQKAKNQFLWIWLKNQLVKI